MIFIYVIILQLKIYNPVKCQRFYKTKEYWVVLFLVWDHALEYLHILFA